MQDILRTSVERTGMEDGGVKPITTLIIAIAMLQLPAGCEKASLDQQVKELCAKDGGVKVYETVTLPAEKFNQWGQPNFYKPTKRENALGTEYIFKEDRHYYRRDNPEMSRTHYQIFRRSDSKLLGETVLYARGGGDMPGPWHESSFTCPDPNKAGDVALLAEIFILHKGYLK